MGGCPKNVAARIVKIVTSSEKHFGGHRQLLWRKKRKRSIDKQKLGSYVYRLR